jgi:hypothetical protein
MLNRPTYKLNPQDLGQARGIGINVLFNNGTNVFNTTTTTKEQVKSNLINFILKFESSKRLWDKRFHLVVRKILIENLHRNRYLD